MRRPLILLAFFLILALIPLGLLGEKQIRKTWENLKRSDKAHFLSVATQVKQDIEDFHDHWLDVLRLVRNAMENNASATNEKRAYLAQVMREMPDLVAIRISGTDGTDSRIIIQEEFSAQMRKTSSDLAGASELETVFNETGVIYLPEMNLWLMNLSVPMKTNGTSATLSAWINLERIRKRIGTHLFNRSGAVFLLDSEARRLFTPDAPATTDHRLLTIVRETLRSGKHSDGGELILERYARPSGEKMLSVHAFPKGIKLAAIVEKKEEDAYLAARYVEQKLFNWMIYALPVLGIAALIFLPLLRAFLSMGRTPRRRSGENMSSDVARMLTENNAGLIRLRQQFEKTQKELRQTQAQLARSEKNAHEVRTRFGVIRGAAGTLSGNLDEMLSNLPKLCASLPDDMLEAFFSLIQKSRHHQTELSAEEIREARCMLVNQLEMARIQSAGEFADMLTDMGIHENVEPFVPLLTRTDAPEILRTASHLSELQRSNQIILTAVDQASEIVSGSKAFAHEDDKDANLSKNIEWLKSD